MKKLSTLITQNKKLFWAAALVPALVLTGFQDEPIGKRIKRLLPEEASRMAKAIEAEVTPELAQGLTLRIWGVDSLIADPMGSCSMRSARRSSR